MSVDEPAYGIRVSPGTEWASAPMPAETDLEAGRPDPAPPPPASRRPRRPLAAAAVSVAAVAALAAGFYGWSVLAETELRQADARLATAVAEHTAAETASDARMRSVDALLARVESVAAAPEFSADTSAEAEPFRTAVAELETVGEDAGPAAPAPAPADPAGYRPPWELLADASATDRLAQATAASTAAIRDAADAASQAEKAADAAEGTYFTALATRARDTIAASTLATKSSQVDLIRQVEIAEDRASSASRDGAFVSAFAAAQQAVIDSQNLLAAEQDDPSLAVRHEIEAYARSISNGITLDFVWAPEVSGLGEGWLSGTAQTWDSDGGWAIISLNYPVEEEWDSDTNPRAVVTHEVGHTQVYRENCWPLFSGPVFEEDHEIWATAWAISQGFDVPGSGIEAYGRPTDEQIAVAGQCR